MQLSPRTNSRVAGHLGVRLPATLATQGALDDEDFFIVEGSEKCCTTQRKFPQTAICRAPEIISSVKVRTALRATKTRSIDCAHSPFCVNGGETPLDSSSPQRGKCEGFVHSYSKNMYPLLNQVASTQDLPKKSRTLHTTGNTQTPDKGSKIRGQRRSVQISKCEQRDKAGEEGIVQKPP